tara:strand:+ start:488 stop:655 length:168 start_codon:yes stop_codon:yes gene_type:complete
MQQLELFKLPNKEEQLALHDTLFRVDFTYDEAEVWYKRYTLLKYGREGVLIKMSS